MPRLALYHYTTCFFCHRVRQVIKSLGIDAELRNIHKESRWRDELVDATGRQTTPVLRIEGEDGQVEWMAESRDIVTYLTSIASKS
jgi:glutathione S-transferase